MKLWRLGGSFVAALLAVGSFVSVEFVAANLARAESPTLPASTSTTKAAKPKKSPELLRQEIDELTKKIEAEPKVAKNYGRRGLRYHDLGEYQKALTDFDNAIALDPKENRVYGFKADVYDDMGNTREAIKQLSISINIGPDNVSDRIRRSILFRQVKEYGNALEDAEKARELRPASPVAWSQLGRLHLETSSNEDAVRDFSQAIKLNPTNGEAFYFRGVAHSRMNRKPEAEADLTKARQLGFTVHK